jgi:2-succinyl-6-hydroxy-2,4-cyclohexadiene-1-carboxylate synthase
VPETVVMLHGFGGTARHWDRVVALLDRERYSPLALELSESDPLSLAGAIEMIGDAAPERFMLCGYSMGGRIALHVAAAMPGRVSRLVLLSTSAGTEDATERVARRESDAALARDIERGTINDFVARWSAVPLFAGDPDWVAAEIVEDERRLTTQQLADTLRAFGAGTLESLWDHLAALDMPVAVLAGARDAAYCRIGERLAGMLANGRYEQVAGAGHRLALEAPAAVVAAYDA